jgi:hypothetical protein
MKELPCYHCPTNQFDKSTGKCKKYKQHLLTGYAKLHYSKKCGALQQEGIKHGV